MKSRFSNPFLACPLLVGALVSESHADTEFIWNPAATTNSLNSSGNWFGGVVPATSTSPTTSQNTDILVFTNAAQEGSLSWGGARNLGGIEFRGAEVGSYTLATGAANPRMIMTLDGKISMDAGVLASQALSRLGFSGIGGSYTIENLATSPDASLTLESTIINYSTEAMTMVLGGSNTGQNTSSGAISENSGAGALTLEKSGPGSWVISGSNSYTGGTVLQEGNLALRRSGNALGSGPLTINGGTIGSVVVARNFGNDVTINGDFQLGRVSIPGLSNQPTTFNGTVDLGGATRTITLGNSATFNNEISNGGLVIEFLSENATFTLAGNSTYEGTTDVNGGTLRIDGDNSAATGTITVAGDATLAGNGASGAAVVFSPGGMLAASITDWSGDAGIGYDDLAVESLDVGGALAVVVSTPGLSNFEETDQSFTILTASGGISGFDSGLASVSAPGFPGIGTWDLVQDGNSLVLQYTAGRVDQYLAWIEGFEVTDISKAGDPDHDGITNLMEFVLNGNPGQADTAILPVSETTATHLVLSFTRRTDSVDIEQVVQYGATLSGWTDLVIPAAGGEHNVGVAVISVVRDSEAGTDAITVSIPLAGPKLFARLVVTAL